MGGEVSRVSAISASQAIKRDEVSNTYDNYVKLFDEKKGGSVEKRESNYESMVNSFYNMVTDIYEFGWGQSFHFAPRHKWESFQASIARHEMWLAHKLKLEKGKKAIDLGCGVGGPGRTMARFSQASITGLNNNEYQVKRCREITKQQGLSHLCDYIKGDWMHLPGDDNTFDAAFHVEAIEHSPDRVAAFKEICRTIKPGGYFAGFDWVITDKCDLKNTEHVRLKKSIEKGNGVADLKYPGEVIQNLKDAGFEVIEHFDTIVYNSDFEYPWYDSLDGKYLSLSNFKHTPTGRWLTNKFVWALETMRIAPKGTLAVHNLLVEVAVDLVEAGRLGIFSPSYFYLCRKPETSKNEK